VFEHSAEGIFVTDAANRIVQVNRAFTEITGYEAADAIGQNPRLLSAGQHAAGFYQAMWGSLRQKGHWQGEVINRRKNGEVFAEWLNISAVADEHGEVLRHVAIFSDITERKVSEERTRFLAQHDVLTGLVNRALLGDRLTSAVVQARRGGRRVGVLMLDLDRFKPINDHLGHAVGDQLLREVARRLTGGLRLVDTVARIGGDEFAIVLLGIHGAADAALVADRLIARLEAPFDLAGRLVTVGASIGIALDQDGSDDVDALLRDAEGAMYRAKQAGGNAYALAAGERVLPMPVLPMPVLAEATVA
jgi:diguanylate cyclase (GGDEF)-like protein/PAS domain S-box-containing protein